MPIEYERLEWRLVAVSTEETYLNQLSTFKNPLPNSEEATPHKTASKAALSCCHTGHHWITSLGHTHPYPCNK
jgi:hypothetical protein